MAVLAAVDLDESLRRIGSQPDRRAHADAIIDSICACRTHQSAPIDLRIATILRLLNLDRSLVYDSPHRQHLRDSIHERLEQTNQRLLDHYSITPALQAFEWYRRIEHLPEDGIRALNTALAIYDGVSTVANLRERLLRTLTSFLCGVVVMPFLELGGDTCDIINRCFGRIVTYVDADVYDARTAFDDAVDTVSSTIAAFEHSPTSLGRPILEVYQRIRDDLITHSTTNPHLQPARLSMTTDLRRHPLHVPDLALNIPIELINTGGGTAANVEVHCMDALGLKIIGSPIPLQSLNPGRMIIELAVQTHPDALESTQGTFCDFRIDWINGDGTNGHYRDQHWIQAQDQNVNWDRLTRSNPYSLDAVRKPADLVGRQQILNRIISTVNTDTVGSLYIHGEKRVGKTSLAHVALSILEDQFDIATLFVDIGNIHNPEPSVLIDNLTKNIVRRLNHVYGRWVQTELIDSDGTLAPLIEYVERLVESRPQKRIVVALDEFDRLPHDMLQRSPTGDNFFLGLRGLSAVDGVGVLLIGAERMKLVTNALGVELNRFRGFPVDYINRSTHWAEFKELIQAPTKEALEFTDKAFDRIYTYTEGNPYYTKYLCSKLLERAAHRRDAFIDERDVDAGIEHLLVDMDAIGFSHYWEDFILGDDTARNLATVNRRVCLLAFGQAAGLDGTATRETILRCATDLSQSFEDTRNTIEEFIMRRILRVGNDESQIEARVGLFGRWIRERGQDQILFGVEEYDSVRSAIALRRANTVTRDEAKGLVSRWSLYRGEYISPERLLEYLRQFGDEYRQRLIFRLLKGIRFIGVAETKALVREAYKVLADDMNERFGYGKWNTSQICVSYAGSSVKSSNAMGRTFTLDNPLTVTHHFTSPRNLRQKAESGATDVIIVDDFIGSGDTLSAELPKLRRRLGTNQVLHLFVLCGLETGVTRVKQRALEVFGAESVRIDVLSLIPEYPWPFETRANLFTSVEMAQDAHSLVQEFGGKLEPRTPLGYGKRCALVVFSNTIPNNAPPILRKTVSGKVTFEALFRRP